MAKLVKRGPVQDMWVGTKKYLHGRYLWVFGKKNTVLKDGTVLSLKVPKTVWVNRTFEVFSVYRAS